MTKHVPNQAQITHDAELVYNYHRMRMPLPTVGVDAIFCLCSLDLRVAQRAAELYLNGHGRWLIFSGGLGKVTAGLPLFQHNPEAVVFARVAREMGVPEERIIVESKSTNTGENVRLTHALLSERGLLQDDMSDRDDSIRSFVLVQKPYMERRTYATFMKQWPGISSKEGEQRFKFTVASPQLEFSEYPDEHNPRELIINLMVGDLVRIRDYPAKGYQIPQDIPEEVWEAGRRLIAAGFNQHPS